MGLNSVFSTDFAWAFTIAVILSLFPWFYFIRKKKISIGKNTMIAFIIWTVSVSVCVTVIFAVIPTFCYLLCGNFTNTPWAILSDYQPRFFAFIGSMFILVIAINGLNKGKFTL